MPDDAPEIGHRIVVWGVTGSGKTTLSQQLARALRLPVIQLDAIRHRNGWDSTDWPEFRAELVATLDLASDGWVVDGSYSQIMDVYLSRADTVVWIKLPWRVSFSQLLKRTVGRAIDQRPLYSPSGPHESWRQSFFDRRSILWWSISHHRSSTRDREKRVAALPERVRVHILRNRAEVSAFREAVEARRSANSSSPISD